ncbi:DUF3231 family protein [Priestia flexa]|uniref:DUF3231 family protein n=1 Tax=Priestia flexa TaxID=86664 RepID=A0ABU4J242_9BACI|nr:MULTISPECIES: DUF3231 family protein [Priestia]MDW8515062.1 DUF3231 family protein [Priestia flexa]
MEIILCNTSNKNIHGIETNNIGMQLITGFAQCAENKEVKQYFVRGKELAKLNKTKTAFTK